ncbi:hypothetical protein [Clostridium akagii]|uniref:hypothetical protein n=1 Tax=Clostridium akagii TaxID=91623 RepID=UPI00047C1DE6|nr:hypothetical protein [Clostridium akagii]
MLEKYYSSLIDIAMNAKCYMIICKHYIEMNQKYNNVKARYGNANGISFLIAKLIPDISVFVYESINFINSIEDNTIKKAIKEAIPNRYQEDYFNDLKLIRNNIHLYNTYGSYKDKADNIIDSKLDEFKLKNHDLFYLLRNDISLIYKIINNSGLFLGTDYFYNHYLYEVDGSSWTPEQIIKYSSTTSSILFLISTKVADIKVPMIKFKNVELHIEFFDYKSEKLFKNIDIDYTTAFRLILILTELSYISILVDDILESGNLHDANIMWVLFLGKYVATKYDESLDSIENMLKYSKDKAYLQKLFNSNNFKISSLYSRKFGRDLRNMLHFGLKDINKQEYYDISKFDLTKLYLFRTNTDNIEQFISKYLLMRDDMKIIESRIRDVFKIKKLF